MENNTSNMGSLMKNITMIVMSLFIFCNLGLADTYRTLTVLDLSVAKPISKKAVTTLGDFTLTNTSKTTVNALYVEFSAAVSIVGTSGVFTEGYPLGGNGNVWMLSGSNIENGQNLDIRVSTTKKSVKISKWCWLYNDVQVGKLQGKRNTTESKTVLPMPNTANVREELFTQRGATITVGIPSPGQKNEVGWVSIRASKDLLKSLSDAGNVHFGQSRGFAMLSNGAKFRGEHKSLTPSMMNNELFADLVSLKFNIVASDMGITPMGFGELIYKDEYNFYDGMTVREIALQADSLMTFWQGVTKAEYQRLDSVVGTINYSFTGEIDTVSFVRKLKLTGVACIYGENHFIVNPNAKTVKTQVSNDNNSTIQLPLISDLMQNYPNPFNPTTTISFTLPVSSIVTLKVYTMLGQEVATLMNEVVVNDGTREVTFSGDNLSSGLYIYHLTAKGTDGSYFFEKSMCMSLLK